MYMYKLKQFIDAYVEAYGTTKRGAKAVFKTVDEEYKRAIIDGFKMNAEKAALDD